MLVDTILLPRFLILELVVACHYLDYTQAFRVFGEGGANNGVHHNKEDDPRSFNERLITFVENTNNLERNGVASPKEVVGKNYLGEGHVTEDSENVDSMETRQL